MMNKPFSQACENNKQPILSILNEVFTNTKHVLEIGSGSGQHAVFFGKYLPDLTWHTSDLAMNHQGINAWLDEAALTNVKSPIVIDLNDAWKIAVQQDDKTESTLVDGIYTANTLHIISWPLVVKFFESIAGSLASKGSVCIYGPFKYQGQFTSESNANFDLWLKDRDVNSGIRDIEAILALATAACLNLVEDHEMPANNRLLVFTKD